ncbi:SagB/ThcOx family dehydrogenase [Fuchsiella alkaliacetigena]|uniref:SagB/ThcOx family dehydrogenase n=1 Tax=Fuchsiella alkaliacetigena TaxID=957042 RepID=UPI00200AF9BA|nr:SagB/ThcOx family dehydrogenase [Fuchsiella alkaliacetigena]MCK8825414.1 SagB/ThcOx family dehydrogenase [Fuchsiella alkaliacetigena]
MEEIGRQFIERTKIQYAQPTGQMQGEPQPPVERSYDSQAELIELPQPQEIDLNLADISLQEAIELRRSRRSYSEQSLSKEELSYLLWNTQGVSKTTRNVTLRTVPSAGARHALETYLLINNVEGLAAGLYRFLAIEHKLLLVKTGEELAEKFSTACLNQDFIKQSAVTFIWTAVVERMSWRYGQRGYRYLHLDAGHVAQNLYLSAEVIDCGVCAIGAFDDDQLNQLLEVDGEKQFAIYLATLGKK